MKLNTYVDYDLSQALDIQSASRSPVDVDKQNALKFIMDDGSWYALRPSGTEPKIKIYLNTVGKNEEEARKKLDYMKKQVISKLEEIE